VEPNAILAAGDLGGIGAAVDDGCDDGGVARRFGGGGEDDAVTEPQAGVGGEAFVDRNRPLRVESPSEQGE